MVTKTKPTFGERMALLRAKKAAERAAASAARAMTEEEEFLAQQSEPSETTENFSASDGTPPAVVTHRSPFGRVIMWKPMENGQYAPRVVSETSKMINLRNGWKIACPECHTNHEASPYPIGDPNACPARAPIPWMACPVCGKRIFDNVLTSVTQAPVGMAPDAESFVEIEQTELTTPAERLRYGYHRHMWYAHEQQAQMRGLPQLPERMQPQKNALRPI